MDSTAYPDPQFRESNETEHRPGARPGDGQSNAALQQAVEELQVHRIELEMQTRALQEAQQEIEYSLQRYSDLYDHLPVGYVTLTPEGQIMEANLTAADWFGVERPKLRGMFLNRFLNPFDAGRFAAHLESCLADKSEKAFDTTIRLESGNVMLAHLSSRVSPVSRPGETHLLVAITNLTQLKQTQQVLTEIKREQDALGDSISHDLRSPLVTIGTYARIVLSDFGHTLVPEVKGMVERMDRAAQRMDATLHQLLAYSVLAREDALPEKLNLEELVNGVLTEFRGKVEACCGEVTVVRPLAPVRGCPRLLAPALSNLISNALKFTQPDQPPRVTISAEERGQFVVLKVADQGIGIDPQHHERIFGVFDRLHGYSTYPGAGVGLAIVRRAVERMNGRTWVESEKGKGSCFHLMLPRA